MKSQYKLKNIFFFSFSTAMALIGLWLYGLDIIEISFIEIFLFLIFYFFVAFSITAGYHRYYSHKSFKAHPLMECFFLVFGSAAFMNSALKWAKDHRNHHTYTDDEEKDPYSIKRGYFYAHLGWACLNDKMNFLDFKATDLDDDQSVQWQDKNIILLSVFMGFGLPVLIGFLINNVLFGFFFLFALRVVIFHHAVFSINSYCHRSINIVGTQISATNSLLVSLLTLGDGYHKHHHVYPIDFRAGRRWYNWDPNKWILVLLSKIKLVTKLRIQNER
jgi:stearoyl-CoA desaturase (Delta-9 desaturase)